MAIFRVQLWPNGKWDGQPYQKVEATSAREAAETLLCVPLDERGGGGQIRARVRPFGQGDAIEFYER